MEKIKRFLKEEEGVTAIEYGLIAALIAVAIVTAVGLVGTGLTNTFNSCFKKTALSIRFIVKNINKLKISAPPSLQNN